MRYTWLQSKMTPLRGRRPCETLTLSVVKTRPSPSSVLDLPLLLRLMSPALPHANHLRQQRHVRAYVWAFCVTSPADLQHAERMGREQRCGRIKRIISLTAGSQ